MNFRTGCAARPGRWRHWPASRRRPSRPTSPRAARCGSGVPRPAAGSQPRREPLGVAAFVVERTLQLGGYHRAGCVSVEFASALRLPPATDPLNVSTAATRRRTGLDGMVPAVAVLVGGHREPGVPCDVIGNPCSVAVHVRCPSAASAYYSLEQRCGAQRDIKRPIPSGPDDADAVGQYGSAIPTIAPTAPLLMTYYVRELSGPKGLLRWVAHRNHHRPTSPTVLTVDTIGCQGQGSAYRGNAPSAGAFGSPASRPDPRVAMISRRSTGVSTGSN